MFSTDVTIDGKYLINSTTKNTDHINLLSYADISSSKLDSLVKFTPLVENWVGQFDMIYNIGSKFYFKTNFKAPRSRIVMLDISKKFDSKDIGPYLQEIIPEHKSMIMTKADVAGGKMNGDIVSGEKLLIKYMEDASDRLFVYDF